MERTRIHEGIRKMRFEDLLDRQERGGLNQAEAAELLGMSERTFRRWRDGLTAMSGRIHPKAARRWPRGIPRPG
jgi:DNA-directed RNA polymerase specialized sigma24 family protein